MHTDSRGDAFITIQSACARFGGHPVSSEVRKTVNTSLNIEKEILIFKNVYAGLLFFLFAPFLHVIEEGSWVQGGRPAAPPAGPRTRWAGPRPLPAARRCPRRELAGTGGCLGSSGRFAEATKLRGAALETAALASVDPAAPRTEPLRVGTGRTAQDAHAPRAPRRLGLSRGRRRVPGRPVSFSSPPRPRPSPPSPPSPPQLSGDLTEDASAWTRARVRLTLKTSSVRNS